MTRIFGLIVAGALLAGVATPARAQFLMSNPASGGGLYIGPTTGAFGTSSYYAPWGRVPGTYYSSGYVLPGSLGYTPSTGVGIYRPYSYSSYATPYYGTSYYSYSYPSAYRYRRGVFGRWRRW